MPETPHPIAREAQMMPTRGELFRGGVAAWGAFVVLMLVAFAIAGFVSDAVGRATGVDVMSFLSVLPLALVYVAFIGGTVSFIVTMLLLPVAWLVARALREVTSVTRHAVTWAALGASLGVVALGITAIGVGSASAVFFSAAAPITILVCAASVLFGWWRASRPARAGLHRADPRSPIGLDAT